MIFPKGCISPAGLELGYAHSPCFTSWTLATALRWLPLIASWYKVVKKIYFGKSRGGVRTLPVYSHAYFPLSCNTVTAAQYSMYIRDFLVRGRKPPKKYLSRNKFWPVLNDFRTIRVYDIAFSPLYHNLLENRTIYCNLEY